VTIPETQMRLTLAKAGVRWDAVRVTAAVGERVADHLGAGCGGVVADGVHVWFFVEPGRGGELTLPGVTVLGRGDLLLVPADRITSPPGPHWARLSSRRTTSTLALYRAFTHGDPW
jgi:hypothetical protein